MKQEGGALMPCDYIRAQQEGSSFFLARTQAVKIHDCLFTVALQLCFCLHKSVLLPLLANMLAESDLQFSVLHKSTHLCWSYCW